MSARETKKQWEQFWVRIDAETKAGKLSEAAPIELSEYYLSLPLGKRQTIDAVLADWILSDNESKRFDALYLIYEHQIRSALPALEKLREKLGKSREPGARFEKAKVERIVAALM